MKLRILKTLLVTLLVGWSFSLCVRAQSTDVIRRSFNNRLELDLGRYRAPHGVDIWLSTDGTQSWVMVGRTSTEGEKYVYVASESGLHEFLYRRREPGTPIVKPFSGARAHEKILVAELEEDNKDIFYSRSRAIKIEYSVSDVSAIEQSDLYYTLNSGLSWNHYGKDPDNQSPVDFVAEGEGLYGFIIVSRDIASQEAAAPEAGSPPEMLVRVDTTPPTAKLMSPQPGDLWEPNTLRTIKWTAQDDAIDFKTPVALYFSKGDPDHWELLADKLPLVGSYSWTVPSSDNGYIYLQVRATDRAGNIGDSGKGGEFVTRNVLEDKIPKDIRDKANRFYEAASIARGRKEYKEAVRLFRFCLQLNPYHLRAHNDLAVTYLHISHREESLVHFEKALKYAPSNENLLINLGRFYYENHQTEIAEEIYFRLITLHPKSSVGLWQAAQLAMDKGQVERARAYWKRLMELVLPAEDIGRKLALEAKTLYYQTQSSPEPALSQLP